MLLISPVFRAISSPFFGSLMYLTLLNFSTTIFDESSSGLLSTTIISSAVHDNCCKPVRHVFNSPGNFLNDGSYYISINVVRDSSVPLYKFEECLAFEVEDYRGDLQYYNKWWGAVRPKFPFSLSQVN